MNQTISRTFGAILIIVSLLIQVPIITSSGNSIGTSEVETRSLKDVLPQSLKYAIITTEDLSDEFQDLAIWRSSTGLKAEIFTIDGQDSILSGRSGADDAESLFEAIKEIYGSSGGSLEYLLLGGDSEIIPTRYLWANASRWGYDDTYLSDVYYSSPETEWDADGDGRYGERDDIEIIGIENISFPLKVGRFPVSNSTEALRMVRNVIEYESAPEPGNWTGKGVIATSLMERPNVLNDPNTTEDEGFDPYKDNAYKAYANYTKRYLPRALDLIEFHDYTEYEGGLYSNTTDGFNVGDIPAALNEGCSFFSFAGQSYYDIDYGHSPPIAYSLAQYIDPNGLSSGGGAFAEALTYEDNWNLTNGGKMPVVYMSSCDSVNFSSPGDTSLENMVYAPNGGAICLIGSTGVSWRGEGVDYSLGNWYMISKFWQNMIGTQMPGDTLYWLKQHYIDSKWDEIATKEVLLIELYTYNLLGDPAIHAWIGDPVELTVSTANSDLYAGGDIHTVRATNPMGSPLPNLIVTLYLEETDEVFTALTGPDGYADVRTSFSAGGNVSVSVIGKNYIPHSSNIIALDEPMDLEVDENSISISQLPLTEGATATLSFSIKNVGGRDAENVTVMVMPGDAPDDINDWDLPYHSAIIAINKGETVDIDVTVDPLRSWKRISVGVISSQVENDLMNNIGSLVLDVNARPRFLSIGLLEMEEDTPGGGIFDLSEKVYDPDDDERTLSYSLATGSPEWCVIEGHDLRITPPSNWSGTFDITLRVSDGLSEDITTASIFVSPVNDPPRIVGIQSNYTASVDIPFSIVLQMTDVEGGPLEISLNTTLERLRISGNSLRMVPYSEDIGTYFVQLRIKDDQGGNATYSFMLEIMAPSGRLHFSEPSIHLPDARTGSKFNYKINIEGDLVSGARFSDDTHLFDIDPETGEIEFEPSGSDIGEHWITITVVTGNITIERTFHLEIREGQEENTTLYLILGLIVAILLLAVIGVIFWSGPKVEQYGLEE